MSGSNIQTEILQYLEDTGADQISFRKVGSVKKGDAQLNICLEELNNWNNEAFVEITQASIVNIAEKDRASVSSNVLKLLKRLIKERRDTLQN